MKRRANCKGVNRKLRRLVSLHLYEGLSTEKPVLEHTLPLYIPQGVDTTKSVGDPKIIGTKKIDASSLVLLWKSSINEYFPYNPESENKKMSANENQYDEPIIDTIKEKKMNELKRKLEHK